METETKTPMPEVTLLLNAIAKGDGKAADDLLEVVYTELRRMAAKKMASEKPGHTLQPTALVHEAWLRLMGSALPSAGSPSASIVTWPSRRYFYAAAAEAMRRILIEHARRKSADKRHHTKVDLAHVENAAETADTQPEVFLALDEALSRLAKTDPEMAEFVKLRYIVGCGLKEAAQIMGVSERTAKRLWAEARPWLYAELKRAGFGPQSSPTERTGMLQDQ